MRIVFAVLLLFIACAASYPSNQETDNALELELRSILDELNNEEMTQSSTEDDDDSDDESFSKRNAGGHGMVNKGTKCEIECVHAERHPSRGKGKTIKQAAQICKNKCVMRDAKRPVYKGKPKHIKPAMKTRAFIEEDDDSVNSEYQDTQRRELYDYLVEQIRRNNDE